MIQVLFFTQDNCPPCVEAKPLLADLAPQFPDIPFFEIDIRQDDNQVLANRYEVIGTPSFVVVDGDRFLNRFNINDLKNGELAKYLSGLNPVIIDGGGSPPNTTKPPFEAWPEYAAIGILGFLLYKIFSNE